RQCLEPAPTARDRVGVPVSDGQVVSCSLLPERSDEPIDRRDDFPGTAASLLVLPGRYPAARDADGSGTVSHSTSAGRPRRPLGVSVTPPSHRPPPNGAAGLRPSPDLPRRCVTVHERDRCPGGKLRNVHESASGLRNQAAFERQGAPDELAPFRRTLRKQTG